MRKFLAVTSSAVILATASGTFAEEAKNMTEAPSDVNSRIRTCTHQAVAANLVNAPVLITEPMEGLYKVSAIESEPHTDGSAKQGVSGMVAPQEEGKVSLSFANFAFNQPHKGFKVVTQFSDPANPNEGIKTTVSGTSDTVPVEDSGIAFNNAIHTRDNYRKCMGDTKAETDNSLEDINFCMAVAVTSNMPSERNDGATRKIEMSSFQRHGKISVKIDAVFDLEKEASNANLSRFVVQIPDGTNTAEDPASLLKVAGYGQNVPQREIDTTEAAARKTLTTYRKCMDERSSASYSARPTEQVRARCNYNCGD